MMVKSTNWEMVGAIGQVLGAALVAVSLVYLGSQVQFSNRLAKAEALRATAVTSAQLITAQATDPVFRKAFHKMYVERLDRDQFDEDEKIALGLWLGGQLALLEQVQREVAIGILQTDASNAFGTNVYRYPYFRATWPHMRANYSLKFAAYMDSVVSVPEVAPKVVPSK